MPGAPFTRRSPFPKLKSTIKRIRIFKAQQERGFVQFHGPLLQKMMGKLTARLFDELLKGNACISKSALKRSRAQTKFFRDIFQCGTLSGHGSAKSLLHLLADVCARVLSFQFQLQVRADHFQHLFVMGHEWCVQITATKNESVAVRFEMHPAAKWLSRIERCFAGRARSTRSG